MKSFFTRTKVMLFLIALATSLQTFSQAPTAACSTPAALLTVGGACGGGTISDATVADAPVPTCGTASRDGWYRFVATATSHTVTAVTTNRQLLLQAFSGACGSPTQIACANSNTTLGAQTEVLSLSGLTIGNTYYIRVVNEAANNMTLSSICITNGCSHIIRVTDSFGDGWSGGTVTVTVNGVAVLTDIALVGLSGPEDFTFNAATGDVINITRTNDGSYPDEMEVEVIGGSGATLLATTTPLPAPGTNVTACCALSVPSLGSYSAPTNGSSGAPNCGLDLTWNAPVNAGCNAVATYDVYFGTAASPPLVTNTTSTSYSTGALAVSTTYYWKIVPKNSAGDAVGAVTWSFTTSATASVPGLATYTAPANGATGITTCASLTWNAPSNTGCSAATSYDVYFGTAASPPFVVNTTSLIYAPALAVSTTYYWKIVPKNALGDAVGALTWSFTTGTAKYPENVSGGSPKLWFKADLGVSYAGTNATDWANQFCGSAITLLNTAGADPQYLSGSNASAINFNPVLSFNGSTQYFKTLSSFDFTEVGSRTGTDWQMESFAVTHGSSSGSLVWAWQPPSMIIPGNKVGVDLSTAYFDGENHGGVTMDWGLADANIVTTSPLILGTSAIQGQPMTDYVDLLSYTSAGNVATMDPSYFTAPFAIGCLDNNGGTPDYYYNGRICEVITYGTRLNAAQRARINSYLAIKYGITLGHNANSGGTRTNYVNTGGGVNIWTSAIAGDPMYNYHNDVAGVGREDNESLHQRQSVSQNAITAPAFQVTMGLGAIAVDNVSNPNNLTNAAYMLWGNDGANATNWTVAVTGTMPALVRIARVWRVQETNTVGTMRVQIPATAFGGATPTGVYMITSTDATFDNTDVFTAMTLSGSNWECNYDFATLNYFTFCRTTTLLPVELISFESSCDNKVPVLSWSTASETNNSHFNLQRSFDGQNFETIGLIAGAGNSNVLTHYSYTDDGANAGKTYYYKLQQYDFDGASEMIGICQSNCAQNAELEFVNFLNSNSDENALLFFTGLEGTHTIEIYNAAGQLLFVKDIEANTGNNVIYDQSWNSLQGVVVIRISNNLNSISRMFVAD